MPLLASSASRLLKVSFGVACHPYDQTHDPFHQCGDGDGAPGTEDEIALPMARHQPALNLLRPLLVVDHTAKFNAAFWAFRLSDRGTFVAEAFPRWSG